MFEVRWTIFALNSRMTHLNTMYQWYIYQRQTKTFEHANKIKFLIQNTYLIKKALLNPKSIVMEENTM